MRAIYSTPSLFPALLAALYLSPINGEFDGGSAILLPGRPPAARVVGVVWNMGKDGEK